MMGGVPIPGPTYMFGDNLFIITSTSKPESTLRKKLNSICFYAVREAAAMGDIMTTWEPVMVAEPCNDGIAAQ
jgi:hypothetical protein